MIFNSMSKNGLILMAFALATTASVALVNELTKERIAKQSQQQLVALLAEVLPAGSYDNALTENCVVVNDRSLSPKESMTIYRATLNGMPSALVIQHKTLKGYNGNIEIITAIDKHGNVSGVRVTQHAETPGLGDKVELTKSPWILSFANTTITEENDPQFKVKRDGGNFDQFTGATITPRAVVNSVSDAGWFGKTNFDRLFNAPNACKGESHE
ncbi:electron transport complex subunit RsxG [Pseudoalteromonas xiamenensis]